MPDSIPTTERTVVVQRHSALTYISLGFNALILLLILCAIVHDHHRKDREDRESGRMENRELGDRDGGGFEHHQFDGWRRGERKHRDSDSRGGGESCPMCGNQEDHHGFDGDRPPGMDGMHPGFDGEKPGFGGFGHGPMTPPSAEAMTDRFMLALTEKLQLTDDESAKVRPLVHDGIAQFQKDMQAQKDAHQKMLEDAKTKVRAVLTPEQQKQFDEMTAGMGGPAPAMPPVK